MNDHPTIYLAHCNSPNHQRDKEIVKKIKKIKGIDSAADSYVELEGEKYCIVAFTNEENPEKLQNILRDVKNVDPDIAEVVELRPVIEAQ